MSPSGRSDGVTDIAPRRDGTSLSVARNVATMRHVRGWSLRRLSDRCAAAGKRIAISRLSCFENAATGSASLHVTVDDLVALAAAFETPPERLLTPWEPKCQGCLDMPPPGFSCVACGATA